MRFPTIISILEEGRERKHVSSGSPEKIVFTQVINDLGEHVIIEKKGCSYSLYDEIQSYAAETDINAIIERYKSGDITALNKRQAMYIDTTAFPKSYKEMVQMNYELSKYFEGLPAEVKEKYGSPEAFIMSFDNVEKPIEKPVEEVESDDTAE